jgi:hypothetical protein
MSFTPTQQAEMDRAMSAAVEQLNHFVTVYAEALPTVDPYLALMVSTEHIFEDNNGIKPESWAVEMAAAVRIIHQLRTELADLNPGMLR